VTIGDDGRPVHAEHAGAEFKVLPTQPGEFAAP
jgi:hypothetical protein